LLQWQAHADRLLRFQNVILGQGLETRILLLHLKPFAGVGDEKYRGAMMDFAHHAHNILIQVDPADEITARIQFAEQATNTSSLVVLSAQCAFLEHFLTCEDEEIESILVLDEDQTLVPQQIGTIPHVQRIQNRRRRM